MCTHAHRPLFAGRNRWPSPIWGHFKASCRRSNRIWRFLKRGEKIRFGAGVCFLPLAAGCEPIAGSENIGLELVRDWFLLSRGGFRPRRLGHVHAATALITLLSLWKQWSEEASLALSCRDTSKLHYYRTYFILHTYTPLPESTSLITKVYSFIESKPDNTYNKKAFLNKLVSF